MELRNIIKSSQSEIFDEVSHHDQLYLPKTLSLAIKNIEDPLELLNFKKAICHRCNLLPPTMSYCHEMYGVKFIQSFGWYVNQAYLRFGILPGGITYLEDITPEDFVSDINRIKDALVELSDANKYFQDRVMRTMSGSTKPSFLFSDSNSEEISEKLKILRSAQKKHSQAERILSKKIENIVREEFGHKKIGESWTSETILYQIICKLFPENEVLFHHRPSWMEGLELDIFIPKLKLGIEYQGQQHYFPIKLWGGEEALDKLRKRDARKIKLCEANEIKLLTFDYTEPITYDYVQKIVVLTNTN
ncbi:MAG: hypothetical protein JW987_05925 [Anaerolineaceae bacterium]|nr:hypothetical protein [Anaerolineaceae bacterium]